MSDVDSGRDAYGRQAWSEAVNALASLSETGEIDVDDLERLAVAAYLIGEDEQCAAAFDRAHHACLTADDMDGAVRFAFWLGFTFMIRGDMAQAGGWLARAGRMVEEHDPVGSARGYLLIPAALQAIDSGDAATAEAHAAEASVLARAHGDGDLGAFATLARGQALTAMGDSATGVTFFDDVMLSVTSGDLSPIVAGIVYCAVIDECVGLLDVRRAAEWTDILSRWCEAQPDLVPYRGQCLVHRSQMLQLHGEWPAAEVEADEAIVRLTAPPHPALGLACYQRGELHRLRGELVEAEADYREANQHGYEPMPGLPLLRLAAGNIDAAAAGIARAMSESTAVRNRASILAAAVEILGAAGDHERGRTASAELEDIATEGEVPLLAAMAAHAAGAMLVAVGEPSAALPRLREAMEHWRELEMPYEGARTRVQIGLACHALGDVDSCALEHDAARAVFDELGARPEKERLDRLRSSRASEPSGRPAGLTRRECEVLRLVAAGRTNRQIGADLVISEHTVARHVQNIFAKLGVSSRAAATAFAYEHGLA